MHEFSKLFPYLCPSSNVIEIEAKWQNSIISNIFEKNAFSHRTYANILVLLNIEKNRTSELRFVGLGYIGLILVLV
jgi:hypothetical protein